MTSKHYKFMDQSDAEKKAQALAEGTRGDWMGCPLCGWARKMADVLEGIERFSKVDIEEGLILQERCGGGKIRGWYTDENASLTLAKMKRNPKYRDLLNQIRKRCLEIAEILE